MYIPHQIFSDKLRADYRIASVTAEASFLASKHRSRRNYNMDRSFGAKASKLAKQAIKQIISDRLAEFGELDSIAIEEVGSLGWSLKANFKPSWGKLRRIVAAVWLDDDKTALTVSAFCHKSPSSPMLVNNFGLPSRVRNCRTVFEGTVG